MPQGVFLVPSGPKNLASLFPMIDWDNVTEYEIEVLNDSGETVATTPKFVKGCCCPEDRLRIHFLNYLGTFDAINFGDVSIIHEPASKDFTKALQHPLAKTDTGIERFNVRANDSYKASTACYGEKHMPWIDEMIDSPKAYKEWNGTQGQEDSLLPIRIKDIKYEKKKVSERFAYETVIEFINGNEKITLRT